MPEFNNDAPTIAAYIDHGLAMAFSAGKAAWGALLGAGEKLSSLASSAWEGAKSFVPGAGLSSPVTPKLQKSVEGPVRVRAPEVSAPSMEPSRSMESILPKDKAASIGAAMSGASNSSVGDLSHHSYNQFSSMDVNHNEQKRALSTPIVGFGGREFAMSV